MGEFYIPGRGMKAERENEWIDSARSPKRILISAMLLAVTVAAEWKSPSIRWLSAASGEVLAVLAVSHSQMRGFSLDVVSAAHTGQGADEIQVLVVVDAKEALSHACSNAFQA
jgi:hypothetical protein